MYLYVNNESTRREHRKQQKKYPNKWWLRTSQVWGKTILCIKEAQQTQKINSKNPHQEQTVKQ